MLQKVDRSTAAGDGYAPAVSIETKGRIAGIAVCGSHPETISQAPFDRDDWLIYACSPDNSPFGLSDKAKALPRVDAFYQIHVPVFDKTLPYGYLDWLRNVPVVWMRDKIAMSFRAADGKPIFPTAVEYPDELMRGTKKLLPDGSIDFKPGIFHRSMFRSSIAFIMAKAILDCEEHGIKNIGLWGILQAGKSEYQKQRQSTQYFIEEAIRRGINVSVHPKSFLLHDDPDDF